MCHQSKPEVAGSLFCDSLRLCREPGLLYTFHCALFAMGFALLRAGYSTRWQKAFLLHTCKCVALPPASDPNFAGVVRWPCLTLGRLCLKRWEMSVAIFLPYKKEWKWKEAGLPGGHEVFSQTDRVPVLLLRVPRLKTCSRRHTSDLDVTMGTVDIWFYGLYLFNSCSVSCKWK